jgi:hypothetical protein
VQARWYSLEELSPPNGSLFPSRHVSYLDVVIPRPEGRGICFFFSAFPGIV